MVTTRTIAGSPGSRLDGFNLGIHCGDAPGAVAANRDQLGHLLGLPEPPCWLRQVHGIDVADDPLLDRAEPVADAAVTRRSGRVLAILTADCLPVLFCTDDDGAIGAAHAGWRGLAAGVLEATVGQLGVPSSSVLAWLGPAIGAASYEVGEEVRAAFVDRDCGATDAFQATRPGHWHCDLTLLARQRLRAIGITSIYGGGFDTFTDARFYSYRRAPQTGRFASLIWRQP